MTHEEGSELLAALALDAVDDAEREQIEAHVAQCPRCQIELDSLREVASAMGNSVAALPEGLWSSISTRIYEDQNAETPSPELILGGLTESSRLIQSRRAMSARRTRTLVGSCSTLAAAAIVVLAFSLASANGHVSRLNSALSRSANNVVQAALSTPGHKLVNLKSSAQVELAQFVLLPDGRGYLVKSNMPALSSNETYQLWGIINGTPISIGLMGDSPNEVGFTVSGGPTPSSLDVTVEPAGGTQMPTSPVVASGAV
jgi:anti-sigma-K factor RskA